MTSNITRIEAIEDNAGGLHIAIFDGSACTHLFSGFEHGGADAPSMQEEIEGAVSAGVRGWDGNSESPQADYDAMTGHEYGWKLVAEWDAAGLRTYPKDMGNAAHRWSRLPWEE